MCFTLPHLLCSALVFAALSFFLYVPLYDGIADRSKVRFVLLMSRSVKALSTLGETLGLDSEQNITRKLSHLVLENNSPPDNDDLKVEDYIFDGIPVRFYRPLTAPSPSPCVIYVHGGGWSLFNVDIYDEIVADLATRSGYVFLSIDYHLAPEYPFPIPLDESYRASLFLMNYAKDYGIDDKRIAIAGDSAGGNIAAAVAKKLSQNEALPKLRFQWLVYPVLQAFTFQLPSHITNEYAAPYFLQTSNIITYWCYYIGIKPTKENIEIILANNHTTRTKKLSALAKYVDYKLLPSRYHDIDLKEPNLDSDGSLAKEIEEIVVDPDLSPLLDSDLADLPPTFVVTAEYDVLRDEGLIYAERLKRSGIEVEVYNAPNSIHGFLFYTGLIPKYSNTDEVIDMFVDYAKRKI